MEMFFGYDTINANASSSAAHCNTLQHTATHCNTQHIATHRDRWNLEIHFRYDTITATLRDALHHTVWELECGDVVPF